MELWPIKVDVANVMYMPCWAGLMFSRACVYVKYSGSCLFSKYMYSLCAIWYAPKAGSYVYMCVSTEHGTRLTNSAHG